jgi:hypothetical protein
MCRVPIIEISAASDGGHGCWHDTLTRWPSDTPQSASMPCAVPNTQRLTRNSAKVRAHPSTSALPTRECRYGYG